MRRQELNYALTIKLSEEMRMQIEQLSTRQECTLGAAARFVLERGLKTLA